MSGGWSLSLTSFACPEQYDLMHHGERVGYFRLRHGYYSVRFPDWTGVEVFGAYAGGDGIFDDDERGPMLRKGVRAILKARGMSRATRRELARKIVGSAS